MASRVAIIDHGQIVAQGTVLELKQTTQTNSLEDAYLKITGKDIRQESVDYMSKMRLKQSRRPR